MFGQASSANKYMDSTHPLEAQWGAQPSPTINANDVSDTLRATQSARRHQGTLVGTPGGTVYGLGELGQHSRPLPLFRRSISNHELEALFGSHVQCNEQPDPGGKDGVAGPTNLDNQAVGACSPEPVVCREHLDSRDSLFTEASVMRTASTSTAPTSAVPSCDPDSAVTTNMEPSLLTLSNNVTASMLNSLSSVSPKRPGIQRSHAFRQQERQKLLDRLSPEAQVAFEDLIDKEATRRCRQILIEIEDDVVFERAMSQALRSQFRSQSWAVETMANGRKEERQMEVQKDAIRPSFLVREILRGERSYIRHLEHGVTVSIAIFEANEISVPLITFACC